MPTLALTLLTQVVIAWVAVSLVVAVIFGVVAARLQDRRRFNDRRLGTDDRRLGMTDRRIGLPDTRAQPLERRRGTGDRRGGSGDRRGSRRRGPSARLAS